MNPSASAIEILAQHARGEIHHLNAGLCPDGVEGSRTRDPECPVCQALEALTDKPSGDVRVTVTLSMSKARELGLLNLQPGVHAICEGDLIERFDGLMGGAIPDTLREIARRLLAQDNRMTDQPIFAVLEKQEMVTLDTHDHDRLVWVNVESGDHEEASPQKARALDKKVDQGDETPGWERYAVKEIDQFVTACFTEQGCKDYLATNGHNLRKPYIYAFGSHRNAEWRHILGFLKSIGEDKA